MEPETHALLFRRDQVFDVTRKHGDLSLTPGVLVKAEQLGSAAVHDRVRFVRLEDVAGKVRVDREVVVPSLGGTGSGSHSPRVSQRFNGAGMRLISTSEGGKKENTHNVDQEA